MKNVKLKKQPLSPRTKLNDDISINQNCPHSQLDDNFWFSLKNSIRMQKDNPSIKGRILVAKHILAPIIQDLMNDALGQIEFEDGGKKEKYRSKEQVLHSEVQIKNLWRCDNHRNESENCKKDDDGSSEWATDILRKISRDLDKPFNKVEEHSRNVSKDALNENLCVKLSAIHDHLGRIIERLKNKKHRNLAQNFDIVQVYHSAHDNPKYNDFRQSNDFNRKFFHKLDGWEKNSLNAGYANTSLESSKLQHKIHDCCPTKNHAMTKREMIRRVCSMESLTNLSYDKSTDKPIVREAISATNLLFEEKRNQYGKKEIIIKCLEDLEKVRNYLECLRNEEEYETPPFAGLEKCENQHCIESHPHLHSNLPTPLVLKLNKHAEENERKNDLIIGLPGLTKHFPDFHILLNRKEEKNGETEKNVIKQKTISKIPRLISRNCSTNNTKKMIENVNKDGKNPENFVIFDPADPCRSIIKMKEQKLYSKENRLVSSFSFKIVHCAEKNLRRNSLWPGIFISIFIFNNQCLVLYIRTNEFVFLLIMWKNRFVTWNEKREIKRENPLFVRGNFDGEFENYMKDLFNLTSFLKGKYQEKKNSEKSCFCSNNIFDNFPRETRTYQVYFFSCFTDKGKEKSSNPPPTTWVYRSNNSATFPLWTIKKSKYYNVPRNKKTKNNPEQKISEDSIEKLSEFKPEQNKKSNSEIQLQVSKMSLGGGKIESTTENSNEIEAKSDVKRKVSFRDEVEFSRSNVNLCEKKSSENRKIRKGEKAVRRKNLTTDLDEMEKNISDLLMTDSLMKIVDRIGSKPKLRTRKRSMKNPSKNMNLTDSARDILAKLSRSFDNKSKQSFNVLETPDGRLISQFYDHNCNPITEVFDRDGHLIARVKSNNIDSLASTLFDSDGFFVGNCYNLEGKRIKSVYDANRKIIQRIRNPMFEDVKKIQADLETTAYYDQKGENLDKLYDDCGREIKTVGNDPTSRIFDDDGNVRENIYTKRGKLIDAVYDSKGQVFRQAQDPKTLDDDSLSKLLDYDDRQEVDQQEIHVPNSNPAISPRFFDKEGNPLVGVYDKKGKPIKVTTSGEAKELLPYLFDKKGKIQAKRYDSKGRELKSVYGEDGNVITGNSSPWLNELLASCDNGFEKNESGNKNKSKAKKKSQNSNLAQLYDAKGNVISSIFDSKGKALVTSASKNALKFIPFLYDKRGKFIKKLYTHDGKRLRSVYDIDGNAVSKISLTILETINQKDDENEESEHLQNTSEIFNGSEQKKSDIDAKAASSFILNTGEEITQEFLKVDFNEKGEREEDGKTLEQSLEKFENDIGMRSTSRIRQKSSEMLAENAENLEDKTEDQPAIEESPPKAGDSIYKFFDENGNPITAIYDAKGRLLTKTKSGNIDKLTPFMFDKNGKLYKEIYDKKGTKLTNIFDEKGRIISRISMAKFEEKIEDFEEKIEKKIRGSVYDEHGILVREVYDKRGHLLVRTKKAKIEELAPVVFDEKGVRRKVYNKEGYEIGPLYDYDGNLLKFQKNKKFKNKTDRKRSRIFSKMGRPLRNFYDSEGSLIVALYNDRGKPLCNVENCDENVDVLSDFFFDKYGHFIRGRFFDFRGDRIKHIYDSDENIVRSIRRIHSKRVSHHNNETIEEKSKGNRKNREYFEKKFENASDSDLNLRSRNRSVYSLNAQSFSCPVLTNMSQKKFYDKYGHLLTGVYNSKNQVLGYSESGNARVLAPYLFDTKGNFTRGRFDIDGKPLRRIFDRNGQLLSKISKQDNDVVKLAFVKNRRMRKFYDAHEKVIKSVYDSSGKQIFTTTESQCGILTEYLFDENGVLFDNLYDVKGRQIRRVYDKNKEIVRKISPVYIRTIEQGDRRKYGEDSRRFPIFSDIKDKILTVIFDNPKRKKPEPVKTQNIEKIQKSSKRSELYDGNGVMIREIFDENGKRIDRVFDSDGKICEFYTPSGTLLKNNIMNSMFEKNAVFRPKAYDSDGNVIRTIYANEKLLKRVYDKHKNLAKVDSDPKFLSRQTLTENKNTTMARKTSKQINYFSEGSKFPLTERRHQKQQIEKQNSLSEGRFPNNQVVSTNYSKSDKGLEGDNTVYEECHRIDMRQIAMELKTRLCRLLPTFQRENEEEYEAVDSFEAMIDDIIDQRYDKGINNSGEEICSQNAKVYFDDAGKLPISRGLIENTLMSCVHLDSDTKVVGKVSCMVVQHFASLILKEIKGRFYEKLDALQANISEDSMNYPRRRENVCIGTELKFEDSLIGKHSLVQTSFHSLTDVKSKCSGCENCRDAVFSIDRYIREEFPGNTFGHYRAFVCKVPSLQPFVILMNKNSKNHT